MPTLQEKFQIVTPENDNDDAQNGWVTVQSQQRKYPVSGGYFSRTTHMGEPGQAPWQAPGRDLNDPVNLRSAPQDPGYGTALEVVPNNQMVLGNSYGRDVTSMTTENVVEGFSVNRMVGADDQYSDEHKDHFYGEAKGMDDAGNDVVGFVERNNYLDRI